MCIKAKDKGISEVTHYAVDQLIRRQWGTDLTLEKEGVILKRKLAE